MQHIFWLDLCIFNLYRTSFCIHQMDVSFRTWCGILFVDFASDSTMNAFSFLLKRKLWDFLQTCHSDTETGSVWQALQNLSMVFWLLSLKEQHRISEIPLWLSLCGMWQIFKEETSLSYTHNKPYYSSLLSFSTKAWYRGSLCKGARSSSWVRCTLFLYPLAMASSKKLRAFCRSPITLW